MTVCQSVKHSQQLIFNGIQTMTVAQRFTTEFIDYEDRLRISTELPGNHVALLWLTRRLLDRLISHLAGLLERETAAAPVPQVQQSFAQQAAQVTHQQKSQEQPQTPVTPHEAQTVQEWLVREVDLTPGQEGVSLRFRGVAPEQVVELGMPSLLLRQWLGIVHAQYRRAQWPLDAWPAWMNEDKTTTIGSSGPAVFH
jgi:hypothetical protein